MMFKSGKIIICCLILAVLCPTEAEVRASSGAGFRDTHLARFLKMEDGLPANFIDDILQDKAGFLWVATSGGGLCRYDGYDFIRFSTNTEVHIRNNFVRCLTEDNFHRLWIASEGGLDVLDMDTFCMMDLSGTPLAEFANTLCSYLTTDAFGNIWTKFDTRLFRLSFRPDGSVSDVLVFEDSGLSPQNIVFKDVEGNGTVWVSLYGRIHRIFPDHNGTLAAVPVLNGFSLRSDAFISDYLVKENEVWISSDEGLCRYNLTGGVWKLYTHDPSDSRSLSQNFITGLAVTGDHQLVAVSLKGMNIFNPVGDSFERISCDAGKERHPLLSSDFLNCIRISGDYIWLGTESAGLVQICPKNLSVRNFSHSVTDESSVAPNPVNALFEDTRGRLWVGTVESGLSFSSDLSSGFRHVTAGSAGLSHNSVSAIEEDASGRLWVGTWGGGVNVITEDGGFSAGDIIMGYPESPEAVSYVGALKRDDVNGLMWIGSNEGIYYYDMYRKELHPALGTQTNGCTGCCMDSCGRLWMGSQGGVFVFGLNARDTSVSDCAFPFTNWKYKLDDQGSGVEEKISCIFSSSDGTIWLGSHGNGFYRADCIAGGDIVFHNISHRDGLVNDGVRCILEDDSGYLWISTVNGLSRYSPSDGSFTSFNVADGLESGQFYWNAALRCSAGDLIFGHTGGFSVITPSGYSGSGIRPALHFSGISAGNVTSYSPYIEELSLHERDRFISFDFSALVYSQVTSVRYEYKMEGMDDDWIALPEHRHSVEFSSMRYGKYTLHIRAFDESGEHSSCCDLPVRVRPYFYHSFWFHILLAVLSAATVLCFLRWRTGNLRRQREILRETVEERTRELAHQKKLLEEKADVLDRQNRILTRQVEELAGHKLLTIQEEHQSGRPEDDFKSKVLAAIRDNYRNPDLDVSFFCSALGMSKTLLNRKLQENFGHSFVNLLRTYRLSVAKGMLVNNRETRSMNITEIAYESGFNDPKYFTRCFTKEFGTSPSAFVHEQ